MVSRTSGWLEGFISSTAIILVSEIGDKTFFIACLMAMRHSKLTVYIGALSALAAMTILSALMGIIVPNVLSVRLTQLVSMILFFLFGLKILYTELWKKRSRGSRGGHHNASTNPSFAGVNDSNNNTDSDSESSEDEMAEAAAALRAAEEPESSDRYSVASSIYATLSAKRWRRVLSPVMVEAFTLTFLAEWGDRSQLATIALAASKNAYAVTLGGVVGHAVCTGCAVLSGNMVARRVSARFINILSGCLFLIFAFATLMEYLNGSHVIEQTDLVTTSTTTTRKPKFGEE